MHLASVYGIKPNGPDPNQTPQNASFDQGIQNVLQSVNVAKMTTSPPPNNIKIGNGSLHMIGVVKFLGLNRVI